MAAKKDFQIKKSTTKNSEVVLEIKLSESKIKEYYEKAAKDLSSKMNIKGFRKGNAPIEIIESQVGKESLQAHALDKFLPEIYTEAIKQEKIEPIAMPRIKVDDLATLGFTATCAVMPEIKLKGLDKVKVKAKAAKVTKKEVDEELGFLQTRATEWKDVSRKAKKGDRVEIDFAGFDKDENPIPNTESKNYPLVLGSNMFIPGFEDEVIGMKKDEEKSFDITFPENYHEESLKGAVVTFKIKANRIEEPQKPEINDELIKKATGTEKTLEGYTKEIKEKLTQQKEQEANHAAENEVFEKLLKANEFNISDILVDEELNIMKNEISQDLQRRGSTIEQMNESLKAEGTSFLERYTPKAQERVKLRFIVDNIIKDKDLKITDKELEAEIKNKAETADPSIKEHVVKYYEQNAQAKAHLRQHMLMDKLIKLFLDK